jgi:hypothetical protein
MVWFVCLALLLLLAGFIGWTMRSRGFSGRMALAATAVVLLALFVVQRLNATDEETRIERVVEAAATSTSPRVCDELMTTRYLEQRWGARAPYADEVCESDVGESPADSVEVARVDVAGEHATVLARSVGGGSDGSQRRVELVNEDGRWKLDRLVAVVDFDRGRWERAFRTNLGGFGASTRAADCALKQARRLSDRELRRLTVSDPEGVLTSIVVSCDRPGVERNLISAVGGPEFDLPRSVVGCAERRIRASTEAELARLQDDPATFSRLVFECGPAAYFASLERRFVESDYLDPSEAECVVDRLAALTPGRSIRLGYDDERYAGLIDACA